MRSYTPSERRQRAMHVVRGLRQAVADGDTSRASAAIDRIDARAEDRFDREADAMAAQLENARKAAAAAKTTVRTTDRDSRSAARDALKTAETDLRRIEGAARRLGL